MKRYIALAAALLAAVLPAMAGGAGLEALPFLRLQRDPSALTGGAAQVYASRAYSIFSNPTLAVGGCGDLALSYNRWGASGSNEFDACGAFGLSERFSMGLGVSYGLNPAYDLMDGSGMFTPTDMIAGIGAGFRISDVFSVGANARYALSKLTDTCSYGAFSGDLFIAMDLSGFTATAGVSTVGPAVKSVSTGSYSLPSSASLGLGYESVLGDALSARSQLTVDYYFSGALAAGFGTEAVIMDMVSLRLAYNYGGESVIPSYTSAGIGLNFSGFRINAALFLSGEDVGNSMVFSLGYSF